jgi:sterol desaturase/sphingolipid hydroxylase (fatty acid hydroxylase superfamily)
MDVPDLPDLLPLAVPVFVALLVLEVVLGHLTRRAHYETRDAAASLGMGAGNLAIGLVFGFISYGVLFWFWQFRVFDLGFSMWAIAVAFVLNDFRYYWYHRLAHESRIWWAFGHITHHSSQHYNLSTALRQEWSGPFNGSFLLRVPLVLIGVHPALLALTGSMNLIYQFWIHTETVRRLPWWFELVMNTPSHHRVHHGRNARYLDANYAGTFIIWDRLFGTFVPELDEEPVQYGLVKDLGTFNPLRIAYHEAWQMVKDATRPGLTVGQRLGYVFGPPGWSHDGSRRTARMLKADHVARHPETSGTPGLPERAPAPDGVPAK